MPVYLQLIPASVWVLVVAQVAFDVVVLLWLILHSAELGNNSTRIKFLELGEKSLRDHVIFGFGLLSSKANEQAQDHEARLETHLGRLNDHETAIADLDHLVKKSILPPAKKKGR